MASSGESNIDREWNIWKQAARIIEREAELWRDTPAGDELRAVAVTLTQLGYFPRDVREFFLRRIEDEEQRQ